MELDINNVVIIGATGTVGKTISGIFASFGNAKVYMVGHSPEKIKKALNDAALSVKAISIMDNLVPCTINQLEEYTKKADLVFESVTEDLKIKKEIHSRINKVVPNNCIIATGTSGLSIDELADCYDDEKRHNFIGMHFFNPPYNLSLCELIPSKYNENDSKYINSIKKYLNEVLHRDTIIVKNEPAFLANRIGFMFMNEALKYADKYKNNGGIDYIDAILGRYTGRNMRPLETIDFVGIDVHKAIVDNVFKNTKENDKSSFKLPDFCNELVKEGKIGIKKGGGLYKTENEKKLVYDIRTMQYREIIEYNFYFIDQAVNLFKYGKYKEGFDIIKNDMSLESNICMEFLLKYVIYSIKTAIRISEKPTDCDNAMANGFNWLPPLALLDLLGGKEEVKKLCKKHLNNDYTDIINYATKSKFDYRKYIKAKI